MKLSNDWQNWNRVRVYGAEEVPRMMQNGIFRFQVLILRSKSLVVSSAIPRDKDEARSAHRVPERQ